MVKLDMLKGKIVEKKTNYDECSKALGISITTLSNKMNGYTEFTVQEANNLSTFLNLSLDEKIHIFLS